MGTREVKGRSLPAKALISLIAIMLAFATVPPAGSLAFAADDKDLVDGGSVANDKVLGQTGLEQDESAAVDASLVTDPDGYLETVEPTEFEALAIVEAAEPEVLLTTESTELEALVTAPVLADINTARTGSLNWLSANTTATFGAEWSVFTLIRSGVASQAQVDSFLADLAANSDSNGVIAGSITDNARVATTITALGLDATNWNGRDFITPLLNPQSTPGFMLNEASYTLLALDSAGYAQNQPQVRSFCLDFLLNVQLPSGAWDGWGWGEGPDDTAMALKALAPYFKGNQTYLPLGTNGAPTSAQIHSAVSRGLAALATMQASNGGMEYFYAVNANSCAEVVTALCSLGINPETYPALNDKTNTLIGALLSFYNPATGAFMAEDWQPPFSMLDNAYATEQSAYALVAYNRLINGRSSLYDLSDVLAYEPPAAVIPQPEPEPEVIVQTNNITTYIYTNNTSSNASTNNTAAATVPTTLAPATAVEDLLLKTPDDIVPLAGADDMAPAAAESLPINQIIGLSAAVLAAALFGALATYLVMNKRFAKAKVN
ncbi:hypothetical protein FACS1894104_5130 [Actinomycetota bacterium]|nr:hypothetical protein FACS1894104_5130 [Actinomycetota bacterium]